MAYKKTYAVLGILLLLLLTVFLFESPFEDRHEHKSGEVLLFETFKTQDAARIEIASGDKKVTLEKAGDLWLIKGTEGHKADPKAVDGILQTIGKLNRKNLVSKNPEKQDVFQVNEKAGAEVKFYDTGGKTLADLFLGKTGSHFFSTYVRRAGEDMVYLADGYLRGAFVKTPKDWRDKTIFDFEPEYISTLTLDRGGKKLVVRREDSGEWKLIDPEEKKADKSKLSNMAHTLAKLRASGFAKAGEPKDYDWGNPRIRLVALLKDGAGKTLLIGPEDKNKKDDVYVKKEGDETVFIVPKYVGEKFNKEAADLEAKAEEKTE
jgi:hypothetical protein